MSGGMDSDRFQPDYVAPEYPDPLAVTKKLMVKEALMDKKRDLDLKITELTTQLNLLLDKQKAVNEMVAKL